MSLLARRKTRKKMVLFKTRGDKNIRVLIPEKASIEKHLTDNDVSNKSMPDLFLVLRKRGRRIYFLIEDTGRPEPRDIERLSSDTILKQVMKLCGLSGSGIDNIVKILHHRGIKSGKELFLKMALSRNIILRRCGKTIDLAEILDKIIK